MKNRHFPRDYRSLVVDDHEISRHCTVAALRQSMGTVKQACNVNDALAKALEWYPHLIFTDINLPGGSGLDLVARIRRDWPSSREQPRVVVLSADDSEQIRSAAGQLNIACVLIKPASAEELLRAAKPRQANRIAEYVKQQPDEDLQQLFREELERQFPELDNHLSQLDLAKAAGIIHQLIASSALCKRRRLETSLRALEKACQVEASANLLARSYYVFIVAARDFIQEKGHSAVPAEQG